ncbi:MAG TPA: methyltransferase domain-containing protein [Candidatus Saccharimonadales bacterium]|nr:methyltransferase domain-containing protein [Candidatus Saccharimonadales bacterium]
MSTGIIRAGVYPDLPPELMSEAQVESLMAFQNIDELRELIIDSFGLDSNSPYLLTDADLKAWHEHQESLREDQHRTRSTHELGRQVLATVSEMEEEFGRQTLLDIGCGEGRFGEAMARNAKAKVTFLDRDPVQLTRISKRAGNIVLGSGQELPFEDESFSRVMLAYSSLYWAETPLEAAQALNEAIRVTEVDGTVIIIPLTHTISQRRRLLPLMAQIRDKLGDLDERDRYEAVASLRDLTIIRGLFKLAERRLVSVTWTNFVGPSVVPGISLENYSAIIDKHRSVPPEIYEDNQNYAKQLIKV